jgi:putative ABC transport system permease protein
VAEGLGIGLLGTLLGEAGGVFLARAALKSVAGTVSNIYMPTAKFAAAGYLPAAGLAAGVGMVSALLATLLPAAEATRVEPSPAMRAGSIESIRRSRLAARGAGALALVVLAIFASRAGAVDGVPLFGFAAVGLVVAALAVAAPLLVALVSAAAARPLGRFCGAPGKIAAGFFGGSLSRNATAVAALAMALGMTLAMIVMVSSIRETVRDWVETTLRSDLWVKAEAGGRRGLVGDLPPDIVDFVRAIPGVAAVDPFRARDAVDARGRPFTLASGDFRVVARIGGLPLLDGRDVSAVAIRARENGEVLISEPFARRFGAGAGDSVTLATPRGARSFRVAGVYRDYSNDRGTVLLDRALFLALFDDTRVTSLAVQAARGVDAGALRRRLWQAAEGRYALSITTNRELRREVLNVFDQTFAVTRALEAIAVAVAILGIANALAASAVERRRSFGLLRAVGAQKGQIRRAVLIEAGLTGVTGAAASLGAAAAFAYLLLAVINPQSFGWTVIVDVPGGRLAAAAILVLAASLAAGLFPGRLAAAVDPAAALAEE